MQITHEIPVASEFRDVGKNARCTNDRMAGHRRTRRTNVSQTQVTRHLNVCNNGSPVLDDCSVLEGEGDAWKRIIEVTLHIMQSGNSVNHASLPLNRITLSFFLLRCTR